MAFIVGQLAKRTGLTVRALHHYHAIGLLVPSHRSSSGYRLYTHADVVRLYQIQALRRLGLPLAEIETALAKRGASLPEVVGRQIEELTDRIEHAEVLKARLVQLRDVLAQGDEPVIGDWLAAVELITLYDRYCSPEELHRSSRVAGVSSANGQRSSPMCAPRCRTVCRRTARRGNRWGTGGDN